MATPVWAISLSTLRARSAKCGIVSARASVHTSVWRPVSRAPTCCRATRRRARASPSLGAIREGETVLTRRPEASGGETRRTAREDGFPLSDRAERRGRACAAPRRAAARGRPTDCLHTDLCTGARAKNTHIWRSALQGRLKPCHSFGFWQTSNSPHLPLSVPSPNTRFGQIQRTSQTCDQDVALDGNRGTCPLM